MSTYLDLLQKLLEQAVLLPAIALAALSVLLLRIYGYLPDPWHEVYYIYLLGIMCGWASFVLAFRYLLRLSKLALAPRIRSWLRRNDEVRKLDILSDEQLTYLQYIRARFETRFFQAWDLDDTIIALNRMGLIRAHERTERAFSRYEVPMHIWTRLERMSDAHLRRMPNHPWDIRMRQGRYV